MDSEGPGLDDPAPNLVRRLLAAAALLVLVGAAPAGAGCPAGPATIPLVPGTAWLYEGKVQSTLDQNGDFLDPHMTLRMRVRKAFRRGDTTAAVVEGHPTDLDWYEPGQKPGRYLFFQRDDGTLRILAWDREALLRWMDKGHIRDVPPDIAPPLRVGRAWGADEDAPPRADRWYQWHVETLRCITLPRVRGLGAAARVRRREYRIGYRTCPEHVLVYWSPGLGITRYVYSHHGTVSEVDVRLVAFEPAPPGARVRQILGTCGVWARNS